MRAIADRGRKLDVFDTGFGYGYTLWHQQKQQERFERHLAEDVVACYLDGFRKLLQANQDLSENERQRLSAHWLEIAYAGTPPELRRFTHVREFGEPLERKLHTTAQSQTLSVSVEMSAKPTEAQPQKFTPGTPDAINNPRQEIAVFLKRMNKSKPSVIKGEAQKVDIWRIAGYTEPSTFNKHQSGKLSSDKIRSVLRKTSREFWAAWQKLTTHQ
jgi:hypothetical protein